MPYFKGRGCKRKLWFHLSFYHMEERDDIMLKTLHPYPGICRTLLSVSCCSLLFVFTVTPVACFGQENHKTFNVVHLCWPERLYPDKMAKKHWKIQCTEGQILMWYLPASLLAPVLCRRGQYFEWQTRPAEYIPWNGSFRTLPFTFLYGMQSSHKLIINK